MGSRVARYVHRLDALFHNDSGDIELNGEKWLLSQLGAEATVVLDVGANRGNWTRCALELLPNAAIHSFEPIHRTFEELARAVGSFDRVRLNEFALSDHTGDLRMWADSRDGQMSSATAPPDAGGTETVLPCLRGDEYIKRNAIPLVDLLKIDVEGHEMEVLEGFSNALGNGIIELVQFEFTLWAVIARRWLADYYAFFSDHGFKVGKLWPHRVQWKDYSPEDERFYRCNFVAAKPDSTLFRLLKGT